MKRLFVFALLVLLTCASAYPRSAKTQYKVRVRSSSGSFKVTVGYSLELSMNEDSIKVFGKTCPRATVDRGHGFMECPVRDVDVFAQFPPSAINEVVHGRAVNFISIIWTLDNKKAILVVEPSQKDFSSIVGFLEEVTGKKSIDVDAQSSDPLRVFLGSNSYGANLTAFRNQSMEMARDFKDVCPIVQITINDQKADFTVRLNHIEAGLIIRDNQVEVYNKDGDLISGKEGGSIMDGVKDACVLITTTWAANRE